MILMQLQRAKLRRDERCQARAEMNQEHVESIADHLRAGGMVPPLIVFRSRADGDALADGFHRDAALEILGRRHAEADVREGSLRDAILFAVGANVQHTALTRNNADKRKAVLILLLDEEWGQWAAREIARKAGVSPNLVDRLRGQLEEITAGASASKGQIGDGGVKVNRAGSEYTMKFKDMTPKQQQEALAGETEKCRPTWLREARQGLETARRCLSCLGLTEDAAALTPLLKRLEKVG